MVVLDIKPNPEERIVCADVSGNIDAASYKDIAEEIFKIYNQTGYCVLFDLIDTKLALSFEEEVKAPRDVIGKNTAKAHKAKFAMYVKKEDLSEWKFIEILNLNMGYSIKAFSNKEDALSWLRSVTNA